MQTLIIAYIDMLRTFIGSNLLQIFSITCDMIKNPRIWKPRCRGGWHVIGNEGAWRSNEIWPCLIGWRSSLKIRIILPIDGLISMPLILRKWNDT